ncbi:MAG: DUF6458 family protein [Actinomycetota bacterium]|jgi:hypothetical protein|nr:DUF6458 family protein [Actinomycetota bacterium]
MGIGLSILLVAVGAILRWAVHWSTADVDVATVGLIVFLVGLGGLVLSLAMFGPWSSRTRRSRRVVDNTTGTTLLTDEQRVEHGARVP